MAHGTHRCMSNAVEVTDEDELRDLIKTEYLHALKTPWFIDDGKLWFAHGNTFDVYDDENDEGRKYEFLEAIRPYLTDTLIISNHSRPANDIPTISRWVVDPDEGVTYESY